MPEARLSVENTEINDINTMLLKLDHSLMGRCRPQKFIWTMKTALFREMYNIQYEIGGICKLT